MAALNELPINPSDDDIADELDALALHISRFRRLIRTMTLEQLAILADSSPFPSGDVAETFLDLDTWAVCAAVSLREGDLLVYPRKDLAG